MRGGAGSSSGTGLRPCCGRSSADLFARAIGAFGDATRRVLLYFTENFVAAFKAQWPGCAASDSAIEPKICSRCSAGRGVGAAFPPFPPAGEKWLFLGGPPPEVGKVSALPECGPPVASRVAREDLCDGGCLARGSEEDARGAAKVQRERL